MTTFWTIIHMGILVEITTYENVMGALKSKY